MPSKIPHRELRNDSTRVLRAVQAGESFEITNHGEVVAVLVPPQRSAQLPMRVRAARSRAGFAELSRVRRAESTAAVLDELRDDDR